MVHDFILSNSFIIQDGNTFCSIKSSCSLLANLPEQPHWQLRKQYYKSTPGGKTRPDRTDLPTKESNTPIPILSVDDVTHRTETVAFIENITIPESEHETVMPVKSERYPSASLSHARRRKKNHPSPRNGITSENIQRYSLSNLPSEEKSVKLKELN